jgi:hypothetical protein
MPNVRTQLKPPRLRSRLHDRTSLSHPGAETEEAGNQRRAGL